MTPNLSLQKSASLRDYYRLDFLQTLYDVFPFVVIEQHIAKGSRDRVFFKREYNFNNSLEISRKFK